MQLIDTHCHLDREDFTEDIEKAISEAQSAGISKILIPNVDSSSIENVRRLCDKYPDFLYPMMGVHPTSIQNNYNDELDRVTQSLSERKYIAIGEIGLDLYWDKTYIAQQKDAFIRQLALAEQLNLPVNIHIRNAFPEVFEVLESLNKPSYKGVFHCFSGNAEQAHRLIEMGFLIGIGGIVTFKNSGTDKVVEAVDLGKIVLETDAPWLAPVPFRSKRNEPQYLIHIAQKIADIKNIKLEEVAEVTTNNATEVFNLY